MARKVPGNADAMIGYANGRMGVQGTRLRDPGALRRYYRENQGERTQAVPQVRPNFMKPVRG